MGARYLSPATSATSLTARISWISSEVNLTFSAEKSESRYLIFLVLGIAMKTWAMTQARVSSLSHGVPDAIFSSFSTNSRFLGKVLQLESRCIASETSDIEIIRLHVSSDQHTSWVASWWWRGSDDSVLVNWMFTTAWFTPYAVLWLTLQRRWHQAHWLLLKFIMQCPKIRRQYSIFTEAIGWCLYVRRRVSLKPSCNQR